MTAGRESGTGPQKYTINFQLPDAVRLERIAGEGTVRLGKRVGKSDILRAMIRLAANDEELKTRIFQQIERILP